MACLHMFGSQHWANAGVAPTSWPESNMMVIMQQETQQEEMTQKWEEVGAKTLTTLEKYQRG